jgi:hypothetical protein
VAGVRLAHWAEFWAKKQPRKIILGQNFWANFRDARCARGVRPWLATGAGESRGMWGVPWERWGQRGGGGGVRGGGTIKTY